jgi:hypothetical protein
VLPKRSFLNLLAASLMSLVASAALADEGAKALVGTWKLTGWLLRVVGETEAKEPFGPNSKGRLVITQEGHWIIIVTAANRQPAKSTDEKAALLDSLLAYSGKYTVDGNKVTTKVDLSSNEVFSGANQNQMRFFAVEGDKLTLRTPEISSAALPGKRIVATLTWDRER